MLLVLLASLETEEERKTLTDVYNEHKQALFFAAYNLCTNEQMAEDAIHNAFEQLIQKNKQDMYLPCIDFRRRYVVIVRNKTIDLMRREKIYCHEAMEDLDYEFEADEIPVDLQAVSQEEYEELQKHLKKIDDRSRAVLEMHYVLNMSHKEIAEELAITPEHVNTRIARAKAKVRKSWGKEVRNND